MRTSGPLSWGQVCECSPNVFPELHLREDVGVVGPRPTPLEAKTVSPDSHPETVHRRSV